jgi:nitrate/nitrite transport system permease protein
MSSSVRLVSSSQEQPETGASLPKAEIIPYPGAHPATAGKPARFNLSSLLERLREIALAVLPTLLMLAALLMVWEIACSGEDATLPSPSKVWTESHEVIIHPLKGVEMDGLGFKIQDGGDVGIAGHILTSLKRVAVGFSLSALFGVALGILIGQSKFAYRALDPLFQILRTVPPLAWLPISLAIFQQAQPSAIFLIFITAIWPVILNTAAGVQNIPLTYRNVGKVLALNPFEYFVKIMLPATVPHMFTGLRIGVGMSWLAIVAAEMVQGGTGIGFFIWDSYNSSLLTDTIVALIWIGLIGFSLDRIVGWIGRRVAREA